MRQIFLILLGFSTLTTFAQSKDTIIDIVQETAGFPGGIEKLYKFIYDNLNIPESASHDSPEGKVFIQFIIDSLGFVKNPTILRQYRDDCDNEALRVVSMLPQWIPAKDKGKPISSYYTIPILFCKKIQKKYR